MSNVVNLNKFKKQKAKATRIKQAETNRRLHGRTKAERAREALQKKQLEASVDGARMESEPDASEPGDR
jgi:ribosomal protein S2